MERRRRVVPLHFVMQQDAAAQGQRQRDSMVGDLGGAVEEADVENVAELSAGMRRGAEQVLANFRTFGRETRFSDMGAYSGGPRFMALTELVETVFRCPLPIERVGVGAKWEAQSIVDELRLALVETTVYQLLTLSDDYLEIGFHGAASGVDIDLPRIRKSSVVVRGLERRWSATGSMTRHLRMAHPRRFQQESKWEAVDLVQRRGKMMMRENLCINEKIWAEVQGPNAGEASYSSPGNSAPSARE